MENASKALIMAGEILIAIIVLAIIAGVVGAFGRYSANMHQKISDQEIYKFNSNFLSYSNRTNITAQEIATVINFAKRANDNRDLAWNNYSNEYYVEVYIDNTPFFNSSTYINNQSKYNEGLQAILNKFIKDHNEIYYSCNAILSKGSNGTLKTTYNENDIIINNETKLVKKITFHTISKSVTSIPERV